jgi:hypothetical protein
MLVSTPNDEVWENLKYDKTFNGDHFPKLSRKPLN